MKIKSKERIAIPKELVISTKLFSAIASEKSLAKDWLSPEDVLVWKNL